jgi:hypothetical protein
MADFLEHTLANLEEFGFGSAEEAKFFQGMGAFHEF